MSRSLLGSFHQSNLRETPSVINTCNSEYSGKLTDPIIADKVEALIRWHNGLVDAINANTEYWGGSGNDSVHHLEQLRSDAVKECKYFGDQNNLEFSTVGGFIYLVIDTKS
jgi:hypothetical protein